MLQVAILLSSALVKISKHEHFDAFSKISADKKISLTYMHFNE